MLLFWVLRFVYIYLIFKLNPLFEMYFLHPERKLINGKLISYVLNYISCYYIITLHFNWELQSRLHFV